MGTESFRATIPSLTILSGQTTSNIVTHHNDAVLVGLFGPASLDANTFTLEASTDGATFQTLQDSNGTDLNPPLAGKCRSYLDMLPFEYFRIKSSAAVAADRTWLVRKIFTA